MRRVLFGSLAGLGVLALASMAVALMGGVADTDTAVAMVCVDDSDCPAGQFCVDPGHCVPYGLVCVDDEDCFVGECCINMYCVPCPEACCYPDNSCMEYVPAACTSDGGSPQGSGTNCATVDCAAAAEEACCFPGGTCADVDPATCSTQGGSPQGSGTNCATVDCAVVQFCTTDADCDDGNECTVDGCDLATNTCFSFPQPDGTACGGPPGVCEIQDTCQAGSCVPGGLVPNCCAADSDCPDDGDVCDGPELCDLATNICYTGPSLDCDDGDPCTTDSCDQITGCENVPIPGCCDESPIAPSSVEAIVFPGQSHEVEKCVETPEIPPKPDIYFLTDSTGSMGPAIGAVQGDAAAILAAIDAATTDPRYGAGDYKDFQSPVQSDPYAFNNAAPIPGADDHGAAALAAIAAWAAGGGDDYAEAQFYALDQIVEGAAAFRADSVPIVVWFGDFPAHDPVCSTISGLGYDIDEASVTGKLVAAGIKVVAISTPTDDPAALDADPTPYGGDYVAACGVEDGAAGQATRIAAATGGVHLIGVAPADIADAILQGLEEVSVEVAMVTDCSAPISVTFDPPSQTVVSGSSVTFTETISVAADAPGGTYECDDYVTIDGELLVDPATGEPAAEHKIIKVPEGFLTGGGQIGRGSAGQNTGGNVGYLADFSIVGQWQFNDRDGLEMHSLGFDTLQFRIVPGEGPEPPDANANAAAFSGPARVKVGSDKWDEGCYFRAEVWDRGEPGRRGKNAGDPDVFGIGIWCESDPDTEGPDYAYGRDRLDAGNFQIHSGVKE
jgi:hypothetical protein